ncbi:MAG: hypothetical protein IKS45_11210 [Thermoguttaceae bacterium]|nr:hypothetical protein [Thermoguttaceae bacterium]
MTPNNTNLPAIESSSVQLGAIGHWSFVVRPVFEGDCFTLFANSLDELDRAFEDQLDEGEQYHVIYRISLFLADISQEDEFIEVLKKHYGDDCPIFEIIPQAPVTGAAYAIEAWGLSASSSDKISVKRTSDQLSTVSYSGLDWTHVVNCRPTVSDELVYPKSYSCFEELQKQFNQLDISFEDVIRIWIYLGDIVGPEGETQRYKELNRARTDFFGDKKFCRKYPLGTSDFDAYPASTGIGSDGKNVILAGLSIHSSAANNLIAVPLENPQQTSAFNYGITYSPQSPKFARALGVEYDDGGVIFISGTASIIDSESRFIGKPARQASCTLDNIACLIDKTNCREHGFDRLGAELNQLAFLRVYIKRPEDYEEIAEVCRKRCGDSVPMVFTVTDVCRPELLVEMEGIVYTKK